MQSAPTRLVPIPPDSEIAATFLAYAAAVGRVAHAWNYLQERLAQIFVSVTAADRSIALAIWYSTENDRAQRKMLEAAITVSPGDRWKLVSSEVKNDLKWLLDRANELAEERNNAIHAPCSLVIADNTPVIGAPYYAANPRARKLIGRTLLTEFEWCEQSAETLTRYADMITTALNYPSHYTWPERPRLPTRGPKKTPQDPHRPPRLRSRSRRRRSPSE
jgi:hypothetical protein